MLILTVRAQLGNPTIATIAGTAETQQISSSSGVSSASIQKIIKETGSKRK